MEICGRADYLTKFAALELCESAPSSLEEILDQFDGRDDFNPYIHRIFKSW